ncbi:MAG TPA: hypothetical protein PKC84_18835, partial [Paracoccaceae bacterium]|nr:hypothetical protein [Paracoccaceae bacterium]
MNKSVIIGAVLVAAAGLGYYQLSYVPAERAAAEAAAAAAAARSVEAAVAGEQDRDRPRRCELGEHDGGDGFTGGIANFVA